MQSTKQNTYVTTTESDLEELKDLADNGKLFAILDSCDEPRVLTKVRELNVLAKSLYRGQSREKFADIAPYLVQVDIEVLNWIHSELWLEPWGILMSSAADRAVLRRQFRRYLTVERFDGKKCLFRFYDPRILPTYLNSCTPDECGDFYGSVEDFFLIVEKTLTRISRKQSGQ